MTESSIRTYEFEEEARDFLRPTTIAHEEAPPSATGPSIRDRARLGVVGMGLGVAATVLAVALAGRWTGWWPLLLGPGLIATSAAYTVWKRSAGTLPGIRHDRIAFRGMTSRGLSAWVLGVVLTGFYALLYWYPAPLAPLVRIVDPLARALSGQPADQWFLYGTVYTISVLVFGVRMFMKYRHNRYQQIRTASVMFFQLGVAFLLPNFLKALHQPEFYFSYFWPLKPDYLWPGREGMGWILESGRLGVFMILWSAVLSLVATPILTYFYGKRWYCSWVCGCGGLAETLGDPFRQLSSKSTRSWRIERTIIYSVLALVVGITGLLWADQATGGSILGSASTPVRKAYGFYIGSIFSGVIGVGFYPVLGARVWCRFGCPMAAVLGILQKFFSRFRITVNGGQCMSCGNCSTYCEMGIDVRAYAQRGVNVVRASCVGCGVCAAVCPRGVLKLEDGAGVGDRFAGAARPFRSLLKTIRSRPRQGSYTIDV